MDIYVKARKKLDVAQPIGVCLKDFAEVAADSDIKEKVENIKFTKIDTRRSAVYLISVMDVIKAVKNIYPDAHVINVGEKDTVINYSVGTREENAIFKLLKIAFVSLVLLFGSATAIMSFFSDAEIGKVLENFYYMVFHIKSDKPLIVEVPYCFGIAIGIIVFFNHFAGQKIMDDPTPIEVEMNKYDNDVTSTLIESISANNGYAERGTVYDSDSR